MLGITGLEDIRTGNCLQSPCGFAPQPGARLGGGNALAAIKGGQAPAKLLVELGKLSDPRRVMFFGFSSSSVRIHFVGPHFTLTRTSSRLS